MNRYLIYNISKPQLRVGLMHNISNLNSMLIDAFVMNRTAVLPYPSFDSRHNFNHDISKSWKYYIDLDSIKIKVKKSDGYSEEKIKCICSDDFSNQLDPTQNVHIAKNFDDASSTSSKYLIRNVDGSIDFWGAPDQNIDGKYTILFDFSQEITRLTNRVREELNDYVAIHVRRGDRLKLNRKIDKFTKSDYIVKFLTENYPKKTKFYLMTDEKDETFIANIKKELDVATYKDFNCLTSIIDCEKPDNFFLFGVEKIIYYSAKCSVGTFTDADRVDLSLSPYSMHYVYKSSYEKLKNKFSKSIKKIKSLIKRCISTNSNKIFIV